MGWSRPAPPPNPQDASAALERAMKILAAAGQTTSRLRARLLRIGYETAAVESALQKLTEYGYLDDQAYAASRMRHRMEGGRGRRVIAAELRQRGVGGEIIDDLITSIDPEAELVLATEAARRLVHSHRDDSPAHGRNLVLAALVRRGYGPGLARDAYKAATADPDA